MAPLTVAVVADDVIGLRSATPEGEGKVFSSLIRKRKRVSGALVVLVTVRRMSTLPKVELCAGTDVKSRTKLGAAVSATLGSSRLTARPLSPPGLPLLHHAYASGASPPGPGQMRSSRASASVSSLIWSARRLPSSCAIVRGPMIGAVTTGF